MRNYLWLVLGLVAAIAAWFYVSKILDPWEHYVRVEHGILRAEMGDFYPRWVGARALLLRGENPYSAKVSDEIQTGFYGRPIEQDSKGSKIIDEQRFAYPVYVVFLIAPIAYMSFGQAQTWMAMILATLTAVSVILWMDVLRWKPPRILTAAIMLFVLASPQVIQGLRVRQLALLVGFLIAFSVWCVSKNRLTLAGIALALATIKPQMIVLLVVWLLLWAASSRPARSRFLIGFGVALAALVGLGEVILPGWPRFFVEGVIAYPKYAPMPSLMRFAVGNGIGTGLSALMVCGAVAAGWRNRKVEATSPEFHRTLAIFLVCGSLVLPLVPQFNQILLLFPVLMLARDWRKYPAVIRGLGMMFVPWLWLSYVVLLLFRPATNSPAGLPLLPGALALFVPFFLLMPLLAPQNLLSSE